MNFNDIKTDLEEEINIDDFKISDIEAKKIKNKEIVDTKDIRKKLKPLNLIKNKFIKLIKNNTKNFDSLVYNQKLKDINLVKKVKLSLFFNKNPFNRNYFSFKNLVRPNFLKKIWIIFVCFMVFLFIDKIVVEYTINSWYKKIISIKKSKNIWDTKLLINNAKFDFILWSFLFKPFLLIPNNSINSWYNIIAWWKQLTHLLDNLLEIYTKSFHFIEKKWLNNVSLSNLLFNLRWDFLNTEKELNNTIYYYDKVKNINNKEFNGKFKTAISYLKLLKSRLIIINNNYDNFLNLLWHNKAKIYLVVLQNSDEIRPTWGFMWSMWLIKIFAWKIISFETKDVYALEWNLKKIKYNKLKAPKGINTLTENFWLRDSNYYVDTEKSSNSINYFIKKTGYNIDGIIYLNKNIILDFLKLTWPIEMKQLWENITSDNFSRTISLLVEAKLFKKWTLWTPKEILFSFIDSFKNKLLLDKDYFNYSKIIIKNILSRDIMIYSFNWEENNLLTKLWLNWKINYEKYIDFSYPVYTSISWNKSDRYIKRTYEKEIKQNPDCSVDTNLNIISRHTYNKTEEEKLKTLIKKYNIKNTFKTLYIQWAWENRQYVRVLLPKNSIIKKSNKYSIHKLDKFNMVDFFLNTRKTETTSFNINYTVVNKKCRKYNYTFYKQPWIKNYNFKIKNVLQSKKIDNKNYNIEKNWIEEDFTYNIFK